MLAPPERPARSIAAPFHAGREGQRSRLVGRAVFRDRMRRAWRLGAELVGLVAALGFTFTLAFIPHLDTRWDPVEGEAPPLVQLGKAELHFLTGNRTGYPYPIHVDEHIHWVFTSTVQRQERIVTNYAYSGDPPAEGVMKSLRGAIHERGFHVIEAEIQWLTGIPYLQLYEFLPAAWLSFGGFALFALMRPLPGAIPAAAFAGLVPTTLRFMGPAFLVPIGFVLPWLPVTLILAEPAKRHASSAFLLAIVVSWAFFVHLIGGWACLGLLGLSAFVAAPRDRKAAAALFLVAAIPIAWLYRAFASDIQSELKLGESLPIDFAVFDGIGLVALFLWGIGMILLTLPSKEKSRGALWASALGSAAMLGLIVSTVMFRTGLYATYGRWHPPFFFMAAVMVGYATSVLARGVGRAASRIWPHARTRQVVGASITVACALGLMAWTVSAPIEDHMKETYYQVMDAESWESFSWIAANVGPDYQVFLTHPWKAPLLTAMSGKYPLAVLLPGQPPVNGHAYDDYVQTGGTLEFFVMNDVTLVATTDGPPFAEFVKLGPGAWGFRPDIAHEIAEIRAAERARS